jgi:SM-20-related protein
MSGMRATLCHPPPAANRVATGFGTVPRVTISLFDLNPALDVDALARRFATDARVQVRDLLTPAAADALHDVLARQTPWGLGWRAGADGPHAIDAARLAALPPAEHGRIAQSIFRAMQGRDYAFSYARYPILDAYLGKWDAGGPHDILLEHLNAPPFLDLVRAITGMAELCKADAQATLFAPNQFLPLHVDSHAAEGWRVAYVLGMCREEWRPDWGGYLNFYDADGDVVAGYRPRFNTLSMFAVPTPHAVSYVPPFAPVGRYAVTGWFRDR